MFCDIVTYEEVIFSVDVLSEGCNYMLAPVIHLKQRVEFRDVVL